MSKTTATLTDGTMIEAKSSGPGVYLTMRFQNDPDPLSFHTFVPSNSSAPWIASMEIQKMIDELGPITKFRIEYVPQVFEVPEGAQILKITTEEEPPSELFQKERGL